MLVLGVSGGLSVQGEPDAFKLGTTLFHDSAAALVDNGRVVAAIEEERINRIKHTNKAPFNAIRACLHSVGKRLSDVDHIAYYADDQALSRLLHPFGLSLIDKGEGFAGLFRDAFERGLNYRIDPERLHFVRHHLAHADSAYRLSGFKESLIFSVDAMGESESAMLLEGVGREVRILRELPIDQSLGFLYSDLIRFIGFDYHEEYKVMGLAPYGDPERYREHFSALYELLADGRYVLHRQRFANLRNIVAVRKPDEEIVQQHKDFAASLQEALEDIVFHVLRYFRAHTGRKNLCLAGGVAQNCSLTGKLLYSGLFNDIFVQPASHDAGCAVGAALHVYIDKARAVSVPRLEHMYLGKGIGGEEQIEAALKSWESLVSFRRLGNVCRDAAELLADGLILGWVQGRSEFGPRALGNRSILADPRPVENRKIINAMVKKRETFRPFAPAVLNESVGDFFELPLHVKESPFMTFVMRVRPEMRRLLGAVTHVDGSARVQTVSSRTNPVFWDLINQFGLLTGVPVLLNTSFNNNSEPIVDTVSDAIVCLLTTGLQCSVIGNYLVTKRDFDNAAILNLAPSLPKHLSLSKILESVSSSQETRYVIVSNLHVLSRISVSVELGYILAHSDGDSSFLALSAGRYTVSSEARNSLVKEVLRLWEDRVIILAPAS